jgi:pimeloyl-ACP methyl ester carboxylesterase
MWIPSLFFIAHGAAASPLPRSDYSVSRSGEVSALDQAATITDTVTLNLASGGVLTGTLQRPASAKPVPVALIIAGSGPTDRDGNTPLLPGKPNSLKMLADGLLAHGIASLRYDKRGVGTSRMAAGHEGEARFQTLADDAAGWIRMLRNDPHFSTITVIGHSEGSLLGMIAARTAAADGYVSIAGVGRPADRILHDQLSARLPTELDAEADHILTELAAGRTVDSVPPPLAPVFRRSVQPYLISWFAVDPAAEIARLHIPVLIAQGTTDIQVAPSEARLLATAQPHATLLMIEGMNHVLKLASGDVAQQMPSYSDPTLPLPTQLIDGIATFIDGIHRA